MTTISVIIATYGDPVWEKTAFEHARPSVEAQTVAPLEILMCHGQQLHEARNDAAGSATGEWLCFLDADDELDAAYLEHMTATITHLTGDWLVQPATLGVVDGVEDRFPVLIAALPLLQGNYLIIGTLVRRSQFLRVGGFHQWPCYEDWELWLRCVEDGAQVTAAPEAIYRVHVHEGSRNNLARQTQLDTYHAIRALHERSRPWRRA